jgi:hypothetical protein
LLFERAARFFTNEVVRFSSRFQLRAGRELRESHVGDGVFDHMLLQVVLILVQREVGLHELHQAIINPLGNFFVVDGIQRQNQLGIVLVLHEDRHDLQIVVENNLLNFLICRGRKAQLNVRKFGLKFKRRRVFEWNEDNVPRMAAAIAFYAVFSLTPIVVIAFKLVELTFGPDIALREILTQAAFLIGTEGADGIKLLIENAAPRTASTTSTVIGLAAMIFAATGVFTELKDALNTIWEVQPKPSLGLLEMI